MCFADTGYFFALVCKDDAWHEPCVRVFQQIRDRGWRIVTTNLVVAETHALMVHRVGRDFALEWLEGLKDWVGVEYVTPEDEARALEILRRYRDKDFTLTDASSFAVMERVGISVALSCDRHFVEYEGRFTVLPLEGSEVPS